MSFKGWILRDMNVNLNPRTFGIKMVNEVLFWDIVQYKPARNSCSEVKIRKSTFWKIHFSISHAKLSQL